MKKNVEARMSLKAMPLAVAAVLVAGHAVAAAPAPTKTECIAASETGQDLRSTGKLQEARAKLTLCVADSCPGPIREDCAARLKDLAAAMPSVVFEPKDGSGNDLADVRVTVDGELLAEKLDGTPIEVDPGAHKFVFEGAGLRVERTLVIHEGEKRRPIPIVLGAPSGNERASTEQASSPPASPPVDAGSGQRTWGLVLGGGGVAGLLVGSVLGIVAKGTYDGIGQACRAGSGPCSSQDASGSQNAHSQATVSTVGFVAGAALLAGGAVVYFTAPKGGSVAISPTVGASGAGVQLEARW